MAELLGRWQTAVDSNLNAYPGAKLLTFDSVAKTTPKTTYSDPDLTTPHTNPVIANGSGQFPQVFASAGEVFYLVLNTANDVLVDDFEDVNALGDAGGNQFSRDFGLGGRIEFSGADGVVDISVGPPAGDDVGGEGRFGGWDGTQGESLLLDFAEVDVTGGLNINSPITREGLGIAVPIILAKTVVTASASVDIALPTGFDSYTLDLRNIIGSTALAQNVRAQLSFDNAATFKAAADDYVFSAMYATGASTAQANGSTNSTFIPLTLSGGGGAGGVGSSETRSEIFTGSSRETRLLTTMASYTAGNNLLSAMGTIGGVTNNKSYGRPTHIRITPTTGTLSFTYVLIGKP